MRHTQFRVEGIYDANTYKFLNKNFVQNYLFDFRPLSFNFLQQYKFLEMLDKGLESQSRYFLEYANEPDFVCNKMLNDLKDKFGKHCIEDRFVLEFSDEKSPDFYQGFKQRFFWHYSQNAQVDKIINLEYFQGLVLHYSDIELFHSQGKLQLLVEKVNQIHSQNKDVVLKLDWDDNPISMLFDLFSFTLISLPINTKIESSYRNVDFRKLNNKFDLIKGRIPEISQRT